MITLKARYDGKSLIFDGPVDLPIGPELEVSVKEISVSQSTSGKTAEASLAGLLNILRQFPDNPDLPTDGAAQHDHYLYGTPKRP